MRERYRFFHGFYFMVRCMAEDSLSHPSNPTNHSQKPQRFSGTFVMARSSINSFRAYKRCLQTNNENLQGCWPLVERWVDDNIYISYMESNGRGFASKVL